MPETFTDSEFFDRPSGPFFRRVDWWAFGVTFALAFLLYFHTLAPTVTLEDAGELIVAADYLGVPHPPGYPIWTLLAWFFRWIFRWVRFYGRPEPNLVILARSVRDLFAAHPAGWPNPAFGVNLCSAFFGAMACGLLALLVSRSGADLLRGLEPMTRHIGLRAESWFSWVGGVAAGLVLACTPVLWSQSVIAEVYSLNAFFQTLILLLLYRWMARPQEWRTLYLMAFAFGLGLTNHQTLLFLGLGMAMAIALSDRRLFAGLCGIGAVWAAVIAFNIAAAAIGRRSWMWVEGPGSPAFWIQTGILLLAPAVVAFTMRGGGRAAAFAYLVYLGLAFYLYLPVASEQNPPMNWGYPRTWSGFLHVITRGQYERIRPADIFSQRYLLQLGAFWRDLQRQFSLPVAVLGALPFLSLIRVRPNMRNWLAATLIGFVGVSVVFLTFQNPSLDVHTRFIARVQFIQAHAFWALWVGYGLVIALAWLHHRTGGHRWWLYGGSALALALPGIPLWQNARDEELLRIYGGAEQHGHIFGWIFGHWQLEGWRGIGRDLTDEEWAEYPVPGYPEPLEPGAILFGGTDPGRFVPTYFIFSAGIRPDVFLITQNALADHHYLQHMRDLYGDTIWIPSAADSRVAFERYFERLDREGPDPRGQSTRDKRGMVVEGVGPVMEINGHLSHMIFHGNPDRAFYVEVSYPIPWMTPHLEPHGLILRLRRERVVLTDEIVARDRAFWDWLTRRLLADARYRRDVVARKTFSALRAAIGDVYLHHQRFADAEYALRQAVELFPTSLEANMRLVNLYAQQRRFADAYELVRRYLAQDPLNEKVAQYAGWMRSAVDAAERLKELEQRAATGRLSSEEALEQVHLYWQFQQMEEFDRSLLRLVDGEGHAPQVYAMAARLAAEAQRWGAAERALTRYLAACPQDAATWLDLALLRHRSGQRKETLEALRLALEASPESVRRLLREHPLAAPLRTDAEVRCMLGEP